MSKLESVSDKGRLHRATSASRTVPSVVARPVDSDDDISLRFVLGVWKQWWKWLLPVSLLLVIGSSAIVMMVVKTKFRASATLEIAEQAPWIIQQENAPKAMKYVATQIEMLRSVRVLAAVLEDEKVAKMAGLQRRDPTKWLAEKGLEIKPVGQSTLVSVAYEGYDADSVAHLVNTVIANYLNIEDTQNKRRTLKILDALGKHKISQEKQVTSLQELVRGLSKNLDVVPPVHGTPLIADQTNPAQDIMNQIMKADFDLADLEAAVSAIRTSKDDNSFVVSPALVKSEIDALPEVNTLRLDIQAQEAKLVQIEATAAEGKASTSYIKEEVKIQKLRTTLELLREQSRDAIIEKVRAMDRLAIERKLELKQTELEQKKALVKKLVGRYEREKAKLTAEGTVRLEFEFASQELQRALALLATISERESQMQAELNAPGRPQVFRDAAANFEPVQKYPYMELAAATLASLCIPFGIAVAWESSLRRISSVEQLETKTHLGVIGEVSRLPARQGRSVRVLGLELGFFEESVDSLRTSLLLSNDHQDMQVIAVCSAVSGEGKTSVSSQLAVSIARAKGQQVLLIDGDMRAPDIHQIFEIPVSPGLADVLDGAVSLEDAINRSWSEHVHLLPAGELDKSPHKLLGTSAFHSLLDEARLWYRYIVVDTPPVLAASESMVIAKEADGTIVCAMRDFSRENHIRLAQSRLQATGAATIGTVLNGVPVRNYASRYGSYDRYGYANQSQG